MKYEITVTLKPSLYRLSHRDQHSKCFVPILSVVKGYRTSLMMDLTGELNVHYHGVIELPHIQDKQIVIDRFRKFSNLFGRKKIEQINYEASWISYLTKKGWLKELVPYDIVVRDDFRIFRGIYYPEPAFLTPEALMEALEKEYESEGDSDPDRPGCTQVGSDVGTDATPYVLMRAREALAGTGDPTPR